MIARVEGKAIVAAVVLAAASCARGLEGGSAMRAQRVVLQREVEGLREMVSRLERHEPILPEGDVVVAISDSLVREILAAQLPLEADVEKYHLSFKGVEVIFRGGPVVKLRGTLRQKGGLGLEAAATILGALEKIEIDRDTSTLKAKIAIDQLLIEKASGLEGYLSSATMDEIARMVRLEIAGQLPAVQIPVKVQQDIELPAVTTGPVRIDGAKLAIEVAVSQVVAAQGTLWIAVHLQPGAVVKTRDAPVSADSTAADTAISVGPDPVAIAPRTPNRVPGKEK